MSGLDDGCVLRCMVSGVLEVQPFARDLAVPVEILIETRLQSAKSPSGAIEQRRSTEILTDAIPKPECPRKVSRLSVRKDVQSAPI